jgi:hypothetical protein
VKNRYVRRYNVQHLLVKRALPWQWTLNDFNFCGPRVGLADSVAGVPRAKRNVFQLATSTTVLCARCTYHSLVFRGSRIRSRRFPFPVRSPTWGTFGTSRLWAFRSLLYKYIHAFMKISNLSPISGSLRLYVEMYIYVTGFSFIVRVMFETKRWRDEVYVSSRDNSKL